MKVLSWKELNVHSSEHYSMCFGLGDRGVKAVFIPFTGDDPLPEDMIFSDVVEVPRSWESRIVW